MLRKILEKLRSVVRISDWPKNYDNDVDFAYNYDVNTYDFASDTWRELLREEG